MKRYWLFPVGLLMVLVSVGGLLLRNNQTTNQLERKTDTLQLAKQVIQKTETELLSPGTNADSLSLLELLARQDTIRMHIDTWLKAVNKREVPALGNLFADTLQRYYLGETFTLPQIEQDMRQTIRKRPASKVVFDASRLIIQPDSGGYVTLFNATYFRDTTNRLGKEVVYRIGLDPQLKINYVRVFNDAARVVQ